MELAEEASSRKVEDMLLDRLSTLFLALNTRDGNVFDECVDWIEYLLSWERDSYDELIGYKKKLQMGMNLKFAEAILASDDIDSSLSKKVFKKKSIVNLEWMFRRDYLIKIIEIFFKRQILTYRKPTYATVEGVDAIENGTRG